MNAIESSVPQRWLDGCIAGHRRLEAALAPLTDERARRPSVLAGWTVGHLLTHIARNADSHTGMVLAAQRGDEIAQYPGGMAQREGDIAAGSGRPAATLVDDVRGANQRLEQAWATTSRAVWATGLGLRPYGPRTIADLAFLRWREVEVHLIDLESATWDALDPSYLEVEWHEMLSGLKDRIPEGITLVLVPGDRPSRAFGSGDQRVVVRAAPGRILEWLFGRGGNPSWPALGPWT